MKRAIFAFGCLLWAATLSAQFAVTGKVVDEKNTPLPGATVLSLDARLATITNMDGKFSLTNLPQPFLVLEVSYVGFEKKNVIVDLNAGNALADIVLSEKQNLLQEIVVQATRASEKAPFTYSNMDKAAIGRRNLGQDIPYLLDATPSVVVSSDAGAGIGYSSMRIRGTDPTRINVTINGIPLNDAESQGVFWVDLPDLASSTSDIQIQRGVGTSTNGAGAFGASVHLNTTTTAPAPYAELAASAGSFGTRKTTLSLGTGILGRDNEEPPTQGFVFDGRLSKITSDGYIDRASVDLEAYFASAAYIGRKNSLRANLFSGHEVTYQAWNGVPAQWVDDEKLRTFNISGTDYFQELANPHDNEVDDYTQTHAQLLFAQELNKNWHLNINGHYTRGLGFFEQYKTGENLVSRYGLSGCADCPDETDLIRRRWLDNHFYGVVWSANYASDGQQFQNTSGGAYNEYKGDHFGEITWAEQMPGLRQNERYYFGTGDKSDFNIYNKSLFSLAPMFFGFVDMQYRQVGYAITGTDNDLRQTNQKMTYRFFNPKLGLRYEWNRKAHIYASLAVAHREPNRGDFTDANPGTLPQPERLVNTELGYSLRHGKSVFQANAYHMQYKNQLVLTGNINDTGAPIRSNVASSFRAGLELAGQIFLNEKTTLNVNTTISQNKISGFTEWMDDWDNGGQIAVRHGTTDIAFSPNLTAFASIDHDLWNGLRLSLSGRHVGRQFVDNTSNENTILKAYTLADFQVKYEWKKPPFAESVSFNLLISNVFDLAYSANAWTYRYISRSYDGRADDPYTRLEADGVYNLTGYSPQAGRHFLFGVNLSW